MTGAASWMIGYLVNSMWMVPLVFAAAWIASRMVRRAGPQAEHRVWVAALLAETLLPGVQVRLADVWRAVSALKFWRWGVRAGEGDERIDIAMGAGRIHGGVQLPHALMLTIAAIYAGSIVYFAARLAWGLWKTHRMRREAESIELSGAVGDRWALHLKSAEIESAVLASSTGTHGPATLGMRRGVLVVPQGFFEGMAESEMDAVMAHECAHMRRHDFAKNVLYSLVALPVAYHPLLWMTRARLTESREMVCDAIAADAIAGREKYARTLLRLASRFVESEPARTFHAIGIFDANSLERRVMNLMRRREVTGRTLRLAMLGACVAVGAVTCASALALRVDVGGESSPSKAEKNRADVTMPVLVSSKPPEYPPVAKENRINGICLLGLTVNEQGLPEAVHVVRSLQREYDEKAIEAIQQYRFKPATKGGYPVAKEILIQVEFRFF